MCFIKGGFGLLFSSIATGFFQISAGKEGIVVAFTVNCS